MISIRKSHERGHVRHSWLDSYHSFSFAEYYDEKYMNYSVLRVINEDVIAGGAGFGMHSHRDMEIITYILSGELRHQDSLGNSSVIGVGDVQRMTAGTGVKHSEFNASPDAPVHLLQIWIMPAEKHLPPSYEEKSFSGEQKSNRWCLVVSPSGHEGSLVIHQDMHLYATILNEASSIERFVGARRCGYLQVVSGEIQVNGSELNAGDAVKVEGETTIEIMATSAAELLWFDLPIDKQLFDQ